MGDTLKSIGGSAVAILILAIPALFVLAITNEWHPTLIIIIASFLILDFTFVASTVDCMGDGLSDV